MSLRQYIILMLIIAILASGTWGFILFGINPNEAGLGIFSLFYISLLICFACLFSALGLMTRAWILKKNTDLGAQARRSFRQGMLLAALSVGLLYFQTKNILNWWTIILFIGALTMLEFFLISYKAKKQV